MRLVFNIALIVSLLFLPWWAGALLLISACMLVDRFFEAILFGILADAFYSTKFGFHGFSSAATLYAIVVFLIASSVRKRLSW
ncbi:MAG TPA: hypothetical protein VFT82_00825 [Candidatus Paceibacterota bacterium]|nr:hypothetical protein [Candidatus Paceibacterota bacterium]